MCAEPDSCGSHTGLGSLPSPAHTRSSWSLEPGTQIPSEGLTPGNLTKKVPGRSCPKKQTLSMGFWSWVPPWPDARSAEGPWRA